MPFLYLHLSKSWALPILATKTNDSPTSQNITNTPGLQRRDPPNRKIVFESHHFSVAMLVCGGEHMFCPKPLLQHFQCQKKTPPKPSGTTWWPPQREYQCFVFCHTVDGPPAKPMDGTINVLRILPTMRGSWFLWASMDDQHWWPWNTMDTNTIFGGGVNPFLKR